MHNSRGLFHLFLLPIITLFLFHSSAIFIYADNVDPMDDQHQYAFGENIGWINAEPQIQGDTGITVTSSSLSGYIWGENIGWINLNPTNGGVANDDTGKLTGYAWGENIGWVSFSCENTNSCENVDYGVTIDLNSGQFSGKAWAENLGWINFESQNQPAFMVKTLWPNSDFSGQVLIDIGGHLNLPVKNATVSLEGTSYSTTVDENGNFELFGVQSGNHTLIVTADNMVSLRQNMTLTAGQQIIFDMPKMTVLTEQDLDDAVINATRKWDANGDGQVGLEDSIHALKVVSGQNIEN